MVARPKVQQAAQANEPAPAQRTAPPTPRGRGSIINITV
jgi:hypothetical protein